MNSMIGSPPEGAADYYYAGVRALFRNDKFTAQRAFKMVLESGYENSENIERHLENLKG